MRRQLNSKDVQPDTQLLILSDERNTQGKGTAGVYRFQENQDGNSRVSGICVFRSRCLHSIRVSSRSRTDDSDETILKNIYKLTQDEEFLRFSTSGFTLVLEQYKHLSDRIQSILKPFDAKVMFDKPYNNMITKALL